MHVSLFCGCCGRSEHPSSVVRPRKLISPTTQSQHDSNLIILSPPTKHKRINTSKTQTSHAPSPPTKPLSKHIILISITQPHRPHRRHHILNRHIRRQTPHIQYIRDARILHTFIGPDTISTVVLVASCAVALLPEPPDSVDLGVVEEEEGVCFYSNLEIFRVCYLGEGVERGYLPFGEVVGVMSPPIALWMAL